MMALDRPTEALVRFAAAIAGGREPRVADAAQFAWQAGVPVLWGDELVLQSVLMVGYPRALSAAAQWRLATGQPPAAEPAERRAPSAECREPSAECRGEATCRTIYGANYEKLRNNVAALHPALDMWMVSEGYGRTLSRPGLDLIRREFCVIAQVTVLEAERQLHSHLRGARNAGADRGAITAVLDATANEASAAAMTMARGLWERVTG